MTQDDRHEPRGRTLRPWALVSAGVVMTAGVVALFTFPGLGFRHNAEADSREVRVTSDESVKYCPHYSPDNSLIAYAARDSKQSGMYAIYVVPPTGGEPRKISPDSISVYPLNWSDDGKTLLCRDFENTGIYRIGIDGSVQLLHRAEPLSRMLAISRDGKTELVSRFNKDNRDIAIVRAGSRPQFLVETPAWEEEAAFGPRPDEVTVVSYPTYLAPANAISVWSPAARAYSPLPLPEGRKFQPTWSPDRTKLAYTMMAGGQSDIWVYDMRTTRATPLVEDREDSTWPAWSPDGDRLVIVRGTKNSHLFVGGPGSPDRRQLTDGSALDFAPLGSPDGNWIAFLRKPPAGKGEPGTPVLCVMPAAGGEVKELDLKGIALPVSSNPVMAWSGDSRQIAFNASDGSAKMDIYQIGRDGEGLARVTVEPGEEVEPHWSPDGKFISYTQAGAGRLEVVIVPAHGGLPRVISLDGVKCESAVWSPLSDRLAHVAYRDDGHFQVWIAPIDAPEKRCLLIETDKYIEPMRWSPDGHELLAMEREGRNWNLVAVSIESGTKVKVGRYTPLPNGKDSVCEFAPGAEKYRKEVYPAGVVLTDGQDRSDLFVVKARDSLRASAASSMVLRWALGGGILRPVLF